MIRVKRKVYSGVVLEQEVYTAFRVCSSGSYRIPKPRFNSDEERIAHKNGMSRRRHRRLVNANFTPASLYSTLTFDKENEVHDFTDARHLRDLYYRRLKRAYPDAVIFIYMGKGKHTNRIHLHMLTDGIPEDKITSLWKCGTIVDCEHLRAHNFYDGVDHGQDYTALADYLWNHWEPNQGGKRWKQSKNAKQPSKDEAKPIRRNYTEDKPPKAPKGYILVDIKVTKYGYINFRYVKEPEPFRRPPAKHKKE